MAKSQAEQQALTPKVSKSVWIGLNRIPKNTSRWLWVDGTRALYSHWSHGEPNNSGGNGMGCGVEAESISLAQETNFLLFI